MASKKATTGIQPLDRFIGGLLVGDNVVWQVASGGFMDVFTLHFLKASRKMGFPSVIVLFNTSPRTIITRLGAILNHPSVIILDAFTWGKGEGSRLFTEYYRSVYPHYGCEVQPVQNPQDMDAFMKRINHLEEDLGHGTRYLFESLTGMGHLWGGEEGVLRFFSRQCPRLYELDTIAYWILEKRAHSEPFRAQINHITQVALDIGAEDGRPSLRIIKALGREGSALPHPVEFRIHGSKVEFLEPYGLAGERSIGPRIRALRQRLGISQVRLAKAIGVSPSTISQLEGGHMLISLPSLLKLSRVLETSLDELVFGESSFQRHPVASREWAMEIGPSSITGGHVVAYELTPMPHRGRIEVFEIQIEGGTKIHGHFLSHKGEEMGYLLEGEVRLTLEGRDVSMKEGDVLHLVTETPQQWVNLRDSQARFLWVLLH